MAANHSLDPQSLTIGSAARVNFVHLAARLCAYTDSKACITTFRLAANAFISAFHPAAQGASSTDFPGLPEEILDQFARDVRAASYQSTLKGWIDIWKCFTNKCTIRTHIPVSEINEISFCGPGIYNPELEEVFGDESGARHQERVKYWSYTLVDLGGSSKFAKRVHIFENDFGIRPYFVRQMNYSIYDHYAHVDCVDLKAYLMLPLTQRPIVSSAGCTWASLVINSSIDLSLLKEMTEDQLQLFRRAANVLELRPYREDEDNSPETPVNGSIEEDVDDHDDDDDQSMMSDLEPMSEDQVPQTPPLKV